MQGRTAALVVVNLLWSMILLVTNTFQLLFTSLQQCYMPYGYMFSNDVHTVNQTSINERPIRYLKCWI